MSYKSDPNDIRLCPYDNSHKIPAYRFQIHIIKCKKNHPELAKAYVTCPFNATHLILESEKEEHCLNCVDNNLLDQALRNQEFKSSRCKVPPVSNAGILVTNDEDNWDVQEPQISMRLLNNARESNSRSYEENQYRYKRSSCDDESVDQEIKVPAKKSVSIGRGILRR